MHVSNSGDRHYCSSRILTATWVLLGLFGLSSLLFAFDEVPLSREGMLLLKSGKVVSGQLNQVAGGYMLTQPTGEVLVPFDQIQFEAESLREVYIKQAEALRPDERTASTHILLARWCLSYQLYEEAQGELRAAIRLEPRRTEARILLKRLQDNILDPVTSETFSSKSENGESRGTMVLSDGSTQPIQSLAGLTRDNALNYIRTIQPILMNKCGNASCHGPTATNGFNLEVIPYGQGVHRISMERNLASVMKFIDVENPKQSPLLTETTNAHGPDGVSLFLGSSGSKQQKALRNWVVSMAQEKKGSSSSKLVQNSSENEAVVRHEENRPMSRRHEVQLAEEDLDPPELLPDPFDPEAFNRRYHRKAVRSAVFESSQADDPLSEQNSKRPLDENTTRFRFR
ncbi:MAG: hypothetical protein O2955_00005 [Planctomycetota bacterium]|nr:hypothetical protein [Planctomycetota bacterium]MDA1210862.1 hypothetical protein [Planctomycetota bacterium]